MHKRLIMPLEHWPVRDRALWHAAQEQPDFLDEIRPAAQWRPQTLITNAASYGRWLGFLRDRGALIEELSPSERCTREHVAGFLAELRARNRPATVLHRVVGLQRSLAVLDPRMDRAFLRSVIDNLVADYLPERRRRQLPESAALANLGFRLMTEASRPVPGYVRRQSALFRDGLQIALLAMRPLRIGNFMSLRIGHELRRSGAGWHFVLEKTQTKNRKAREVPFPTELVESLREYLDVHRPQLAAGRYEGDALWLSCWWQGQSETSCRQQVCHWTALEFGTPVSPHRFRECLATSLAVHDPDEVQIAHIILGNDYATMQDHYNMARAVDAARHYHATLSKRRC